MKLEFIDSNESHPTKDVEELTLALLQLLVYQKGWIGLVEYLSSQKTLITLSIEVMGLEDNIKTKHTAQFDLNISQVE